VSEPRFLLVLNPTAGKGKAGAELIHLRRLFSRKEIELEVFLTDAPGSARRFVEGLSIDDDTTILAAGGDGTVHEVAEALLEREHGRLGVLPLGSGNDYAALMGVPGKVEDAIDAIIDGTDAKWDVGQVGPYTFVNTVGFGFSAAVSYHSIKTGMLRGMARYGLAIARAYIAYRPISMQLDGTKLNGRVPMTLMEVGIGNRCGGGFHLTPKALPDDGLLDVCVVKALSRFEIPILLPRGVRGGHLGHRKVFYQQLPSFRLVSESDQLIHVDGDVVVLAKGEHVVRVRPKALNVRLPRTIQHVAAQ